MDLKLPELGEGVHEGELVKWRVKVGDLVKDDQVVCEIMTDKATVELPAPFSGKVTSLSAKEGDTIHVGQIVLTYEGGASSAVSSGTSVGASASSHAPASIAAAHAAPSPTATAAVSLGAGSSSGVATDVAAAPSTRRLAREMGVDLARVTGSGPHGRVMKADLERATGAGAVSAGNSRPATSGAASAMSPMAVKSSAQFIERETRVPMKGLRKKIAEKMRLSKDHAAHFTYVEEADASELVKLRAAAKELGAKSGVKVTYLPFIMKAMVAALRQYPILNSSFDEAAGEIVYKNYFNISLSIQTEDGLTAPVVKSVESKSVLELAKDIQDLVDRARAKKLTLDDFQDGTITLTNAGSIGGLFATPVINYPEVAILGFNKIFRKPVVRESGGREEIVIRDWTYFSISLDHRVVDGAVGAEFMKAFIQYIENPTLLFIGG